MLFSAKASWEYRSFFFLEMSIKKHAGYVKIMRYRFLFLENEMKQKKIIFTNIHPAVSHIKAFCHIHILVEKHTN